MPGPAYLSAAQNGTLERTADLMFKLLESCSICPRRCKVNRLRQEKGFCQTGLKPVVYSFLPHHGEEPPISGESGSGAIFFSGCNMRCVYCQNYEFSQRIEGEEASFTRLAEYMLKLQAEGCHNINLVTPTHVMPQIIKALLLAIPQGLNIPLVYNTSGYELPEIIRLLDGIVDIYLTDMRYGDDLMAEKYSAAADYPRFNQEAVREMHRQVGIAAFDSQGIIKKGLIIRHLVMPDNVSGTGKIMKFIAENLPSQTYISLMSQYVPFYKAADFKQISRRITKDEYRRARNIMRGYGLDHGWTQESGGLDRFAGVNIKSAFSENDHT